MKKPSFLRNVYFPYEDPTPNNAPANSDETARTIPDDPDFGIIVLRDTEQATHRTVVVYSAEQALTITRELDRKDALRVKLQEEVHRSALRTRAEQPVRVFDATVGELLADALDKGEHRMNSLRRINVHANIRHLAVEDMESPHAPLMFVYGPCRTHPGYVTHLVRTVEQHDKALYETMWESSPNDADVAAWRDYAVEHLPDEYPEPALTLTGRQGLYIGLGLFTIQSERARVYRTREHSGPN